MLDSEVFGVAGRLTTEFLFFFCFVGPLETDMFAQIWRGRLLVAMETQPGLLVRSESGVQYARANRSGPKLRVAACLF